MRRLLAVGQREDRALVFLMLGCALIGLSRIPRMMRGAGMADEIPFQAGLGGTIFAWLFLAPLALYGLAALSHLAAMPFGGRGTWYGARLALFWAMLAQRRYG